MLNRCRIQAGLPVGKFGQVFEFHRRLGSTNDEAARLARRGAPEGTLIVAEEQTSGRGRGGRRWLTPPDTALALSVVLRPALDPVTAAGLMTLGALAVTDALEAQGLEPEIKWPNDVLLGGRKVAGVLVEASWSGPALEFAICGIGINVRPASVPRDQEVDYPATCVEAALGRRVDRERLLLAVLAGLDRWYPRLGTEAMLQAVQSRLALAGHQVALRTTGDQEITGRVLGVCADGRLRLEITNGQVILVGAEGSHLRPLAS